MENGKTEQSLTDITNRLNSPQLCSASIKISEQVSSSQSQPQYPNSTEQQHFRYDFSPSKLQSDHLLQDLNDQPLLQGKYLCNFGYILNEKLRKSIKVLLFYQITKIQYF